MVIYWIATAYLEGEVQLANSLEQQIYRSTRVQSRMAIYLLQFCNRQRMGCYEHSQSCLWPWFFIWWQELILHVGMPEVEWFAWSCICSTVVIENMLGESEVCQSLRDGGLSQNSRWQWRIDIGLRTGDERYWVRAFGQYYVYVLCT